MRGGRRIGWTRIEEETLIATWREGSAAAARAVSEVSRRRGGPARGADAIRARVSHLRARGVRVEAMSRAECGRFGSGWAGAGDSAHGSFKPGNDPAARAAAAARAKRRRCLKCREYFDSEGPGNRVCASCKKNNAWRDGAGLWP